MEWLMVQFRQILRRLGRAPMFTAITLIILAVGIGSTTAIFSVLNGVLLKGLPYPRSEELVEVRFKGFSNSSDLGMARLSTSRFENRTEVSKTLASMLLRSLPVAGCRMLLPARAIQNAYLPCQ